MGAIENNGTGQIVDLLYTAFIYPLEYVMSICLNSGYRITGSYGTSLIILSIAVNIFLLPLYYLAEKWKFQEKTIRRKMEPELASIQQHSQPREKHYYTQEVYRRFGYHPLSAVKVSFGFLIQVPFFFSAYHLLSHFSAWEGKGFLLFHDLSAPDGLIQFAGVSLNLLPLVMTAINLASAYVYATHMSDNEKVQLWLLSLVFLVVLYGSPAGLVFYWTVNNLFSLVKNIVLPRLNFSFLNFREENGDVAETGGDSTILVRWGQYRDTVIRFIELPAPINAALFLFAIYELSLYKWAADPPGATAVYLSIGLLAYICFVPFLRSCRRGGKRSLRQKLHVTLVWALCTAFVVLSADWLFTHVFIQPDPPKQGIVVILLALLVLLYASPICDRIRILGKMPNRHWLYATAMPLTAFIVCVANPLSLYSSSSEDFSIGVYSLTGQLLIYFVAVLFVSAVLYILVDKTFRNILTLLSVFSSLSVIIYAQVGVKNVGLMDQFRLRGANGLIQTGPEILAEIAILVVLFAATAYATISYERFVAYVTRALLITSVFVAVASIYGAKDNAGAVGYGLPADNGDIFSFSRDRNILIIMLDGFSGGYIKKIKNEAPDTLEEYDGFVWYPNMLTTNSGTWGSVAALAGGHHYTIQKINERAGRSEHSLRYEINEAYRIYPEAFIPKGYDVTYVEPQLSGGCDRIDKRVHCTDTDPYAMYYYNKYENTTPTTPEGTILQDDVDASLPLMLTMVSLFEVSPLLLKSRIYDHGDWLGANARLMRAYKYKRKDWGFLRMLAHESTINSVPKTLKYIQLGIPHKPHALNEDCELQPERADYFTETVCPLKEIGVLLAWLKKNDIYDVTKIVIVSDHGWWVDNPMFPRDFSKTIPEGYQERTSTGFVQSLLMVKDFGAKGVMRRSDKFLSNSDVPSIVCSAVGSCRNVGPDPTMNNVGERTLVFNTTAYVLNPEETQKFDVVESYEVKNSIFSRGNWKRIK